MTKFEKIVIVLSLIIGLFGGVVLIPLHFPPIIPSIFIAMAISVLVYHFLGGIKDAGFNMGPVKMGGSIAALIGCAFVINHYLEPQIRPVGQLRIDQHYRVYDNDSNFLGTLPLNYDTVDVKDNREVQLNNIKIGRLNDSNNCLNYYDQISLVPYTYTELIDSIDSEDTIHMLFKGVYGDALKVNYGNLPFRLTPDFKHGRTILTDTLDNKEYPVSVFYKGSSKVLYKYLKSSPSRIYIVRVRQLDNKPPHRFVQYQVLTFNYKKTIFPNEKNLFKE